MNDKKSLVNYCCIFASSSSGKSPIQIFLKNFFGYIKNTHAKLLFLVYLCFAAFVAKDHLIQKSPNHIIFVNIKNSYGRFKKMLDEMENQVNETTEMSKLELLNSVLVKELKESKMEIVPDHFCHFVLFLLFIHQHAHRLQPQQLKCQDIIQLFGCSAVL